MSLSVCVFWFLDLCWPAAFRSAAGYSKRILTHLDMALNRRLATCWKQFNFIRHTNSELYIDYIGKCSGTSMRKAAFHIWPFRCGQPAWESDPERGLQSWFRPAKPETRNRLLKLVSNCETRNPKPETDSEDLTSPGPIETRNPKPETRNRLWRLTFPRTDRNPKPETDSEDLTSPGPIETRKPKPETDC